MPQDSKKGEWMENSSETVTLPSWQAEQNTLHSNHKGLFEGRDRCSSCDHLARHHPHLPGYTKIQKGEIRQKKPQGKYATLVWANLQVKNVASGDYYLFYPHSDLKPKTHAAGCFLYLLRSLVKHLASAGELVGVGCLSSQCRGVRRPCGRLLSGGGLGHLVGQTGAAGARHGRRATEGTEK